MKILFTILAMALPLLAMAQNSTEQKQAKDTFLLKELTVRPKFMGKDDKTFTKWVENHLDVDQMMKQHPFSGKLVLTFVIDTLGKLNNIKVLESIYAPIDQEVIDVVSKSPKWTPGEVDGRVVHVRYTFPLYFNKRR